MLGLRKSADLRTLFWTCVLTPSVLAVQYARPELAPYLWWVSCYFALACGVIAHNHNHCPTFKSKRGNTLFGIWLSLFYGYPTFAWIPTHNLNHHKHVNKAGDATITWRYTNRHSFWIALTYFFVSSWFQGDVIKQFIAKAKEARPSLYRKILLQWAGFAGFHVVALTGLMVVHGFKTGLVTWILASAIPGVFALWAIMLFNYEQHVHADPWSEHNHSRNFDSLSLNFLLFNNGYHAAHHENPGTHWSELRAVHESIAPKIDPALIESSVWWYWFRQYALAPIFPSLGTKQVGRAPFDPPDGKSIDSLVHDAVGLGDAGTNAQRA